LAFVAKMSEKRKSILSSAFQAKNRESTINIAEKLDVISQLKKGEGIIDICLQPTYLLLCHLLLLYLSVDVPFTCPNSWGYYAILENAIEEDRL